MERREFLKSACLTCAGSLGGMWLIQACTTQKHIINYQLTQGKIAIKKSEFIEIKNEKTIRKKFLVVKPDSLDFPFVVYQMNNNEYKTLLLKCTHQGCELTPYETTMVCPCHGAEFNTKGEVTTGPADADLKSLITTQDDETIYIQL